MLPGLIDEATKKLTELTSEFARLAKEKRTVQKNDKTEYLDYIKEEQMLSGVSVKGFRDPDEVFEELFALIQDVTMVSLDQVLKKLKELKRVLRDGKNSEVNQNLLQTYFQEQETTRRLGGEMTSGFWTISSKLQWNNL